MPQPLALGGARCTRQRVLVTQRRALVTRQGVVVTPIAELVNPQHLLAKMGRNPPEEGAKYASKWPSGHSVVTISKKSGREFGVVRLLRQKTAKDKTTSCTGLCIPGFPCFGLHALTSWREQRSSTGPPPAPRQRVSMGCIANPVNNGPGPPLHKRCTLQCGSGHSMFSEPNFLLIVNLRQASVPEAQRGFC